MKMIFGTKRADLLDVGDGDDGLAFGDRGSDTLDGWLGADTMSGGAGQDLFRLTVAAPPTASRAGSCG